MSLAHAMAALAAFAPSVLLAQSIEIYSEFQRPDPYGQIVSMDRAAEPREILSPGVARNAFASFHIAVSVPENESYLLYVASNPRDACRVALYKEHFEKTAKGWVPDRLTELRSLPDFGVMPDPDDRVPGQNTRVYLLDIWIPPNADVARFRLEVQLKVADWTVRPMEIRVLAARVPDLTAKDGPPAGLPPVGQPADSAAEGPLSDYAASRTALAYSSAPDTLRAIIRRNVIQDMALAASLHAKPVGPDTLAQRRSAAPRDAGAERYLRIRDLVYAEASRRR